MADRYNIPTTPPPPQDAALGGSARLGAKVENAFTRIVQRVAAWGYKWFAELVIDIFDQSMKIMRPGTERATASMLSYMKTIPGLPEWFKQTLTAVEQEKGESAFLLRVAVFVIGIRMVLFGGMRPLENFATYNADRAARSFLPDVQTSATMRRSGMMSDEAFRNTLAQLGVNDALFPAYLELVRNLPNLGDVIAGRWRGVYTDGDFNALLKRMGYDDKDITAYDELSKNIPPISDLIHFMVREAFNDATVAQFGYDDDYPDDINQFVKKLGYDVDWGKRYWRAHWQLPSPTQAYEMLHRGLIDEGVLFNLLKTADYPSYWRERLMKISFNVMTRVDVRRLMQAGLIDRTKALATYREMGYRPEDAELLTQFAEKGISQEERDLTRTDVVSMYVDGITDRGTAASALVKMGYDNDEAESIMKGADVDIAKAARVDNINYVKERYTAGKIDKNAVVAELTGAGLKSLSIDRYLLAWDRSVETDAAIPSKADAKRFYLRDLIDKPKFVSMLAALKYDAVFIDLYVRDADLDKQELEESEG